LQPSHGAVKAHTLSKTPQKSQVVSSKTQLNGEASRNLFASTPTTTMPATTGTYDSPVNTRQLKWMTKEYVSPTPQKNGKILGIFDKLPGFTPTPEKQKRDTLDEKLRKDLQDSMKRGQVAMTPSTKGRHVDINNHEELEDTYSPLDPTTPSRKRRYEFQTPISKRQKLLNAEPDPFSTPLFFKRQHYNFTTNENGSPTTPAFKRYLPLAQPKVKLLSTMMRELREMEDQEEDEGMDVLREIEQNELNPGGIQKVIEGQLNIEAKGEESGAMGDNPFLSGDRDISTVPTKTPVYKKKGMKRQTRRVKSESRSFFESDNY